MRTTPNPSSAVGNDAAAFSARRRRRRRKMLSYPLRLFSVAVVGVIGAWGISRVIAKTAQPYVLGYREGKKVAALREHLHQQTVTNAALKQRIEYLKSPEGEESEARRAGYHRPGEVVYLLDPATLNATPTTPPSQTPH